MRVWTSCLILALPLAAGAESLVLRGRVLDSTHAPIAGAHVTEAVAGTKAVTDDRGFFSLALDPGPHTIEIAAQGFEALRPRLTLPQVATDAADFVLKVASFRESVTVSEPAGYQAGAVSSATRTLTPLRDVPQSVTVATRELIRDQLMMSMSDVVRYVPGIVTHQGENNRDQVIIRGNNSSADFFVNGVRDDVQYYRDLYNLDRVEALKGPNAMIFGRGGGGGVVNRVTKEAMFERLGELTLQAGSFGNRRLTGDFGQPLGDTLALRLNAMYETSDSFRDRVNLERYGISPTLTYAPGPRTRITLGYEHLHDARVADRGIPSFQGRPAEMDVSSYFGNPDDSHVKLRVDQLSAGIEHRIGSLVLRNRTLFGDHDRFYQNFVPGAVSADRSQVALTAYNNASQRRNIFDQADLVYSASTGPLRHTVLAGVEIGRQVTDNFRNSGFFNGTATSVSVPYGSPTIATPVTFRQNATDADNHLRARVGAAYAQDQVELGSAVQLIAGLRFDRFELRYHNNRTGDSLERVDDLVSPRAGLVVKPLVPVSLYATYSISYLPSSGDQFSSLTTITQQVEPEQFSNYEVGLKWDARPDLSITAAAYRLDRTNTRSTDPADATRIVQTGSHRTNGVELGISGRIAPRWKIAGGYAYQDAFVTSATTAAAAGATVGQVPHHTVSLWNSYQLQRRLGAGLGVIHRSGMFAAIDNTVTLPGYTRFDAAAYYTLGKAVRLQMNVENLFDETYYLHADNNNNISPGSRRAVRVALTTTF